jgi:hypothetical protein
MIRTFAALKEIVHPNPVGEGFAAADKFPVTSCVGSALRLFERGASNDSPFDSTQIVRKM